MGSEFFDRRALRVRPLSERPDLIYVDGFPTPDTADVDSSSFDKILTEIVERLARARECGASRMMAFGAHVIKNGMGTVLAELAGEGWLTHAATNGAGVIHDWEFAHQGHSSENVRANVAAGTFGIWQETGFYINLAVRVGAYLGLGYGASVARMVSREGLDIPSRDQLRQDMADHGGDLMKAAAAADLLRGIEEAQLESGWLPVPHPFRERTLLGLAEARGLPLTVHPMIGHDIIYSHPFNDCAAIGRAAERDFLRYASSVERLEGGVYLSVGSAIMSPMVFEKSLSMARNVVLQRGEKLDDFLIVVVDIVPSQWDWSKGEPGWDTPEFYVRFNKTFSRMGGQFRYICADNRDFIMSLAKRLG